MRLYQEYGTGQESLFRGPKSQALGDLSVTKALQLLAIPDGPEREEFLESHDVASMSTRELDEAIKARDEALKAAEAARAEQAAAVEAARKEAEEAMRAQLDQAKAAHEKAKAGLMELNSALQREKLEREQMEVELRKQLAQAEKKTAISADADMVLFSELYEQAQILVNRMGGVRLKKLDKDPENAEKLGTAMMALIPVVKEAAGRE